MTNVPNSIMKRVDSFCLMARPYQWGEFRDIKLQPTSATSIAPSAVTETAAAHIAQGKKLQQNGLLSNGIPEFRKAIQIDPDNADAHVLLAEALYWMKSKRFVTPTRATVVNVPAPPAILDEVIMHMEKAVALRPDYVDWQFQLGTFLEARGRNAEVITVCKEGLNRLGPLKPENNQHQISNKLMVALDLHLLLARNFMQMKRYSEALAHYEDMSHLHPLANPHLLEYGDALYKTGQKPEARATWKKAVSNAPPTDKFRRKAQKRLANH